jgi:hypothetical protein
VTCFLRVRRLRNTKQAALSACTIEDFIRGTEMSKQSVFKEQSYESVVRGSPTSEVSIGDRHGKCEDVKCVRKSVISDCSYERVCL